jgi:hypothetical protein
MFCLQMNVFRKEGFWCAIQYVLMCYSSVSVDITYGERLGVICWKPNLLLLLLLFLLCIFNCKWVDTQWQ